VTSSSVSLGWSASSGTVTSYLIERATGATSTNFSQIATSATNSFTDSGLSANTTYRYRVRASNSAGTSGYSGIANATTTGGGGGAACATTGTPQSQWNNGYVMQMTVTNTGSTTLNGWTSTVMLPAGHSHTGSWPVTATVSGQNIIQRNQAWNGTLSPGQSASWGFQASRPNGNTQLPTAFTCTSPKPVKNQSPARRNDEPGYLRSSSSKAQCLRAASPSRESLRERHSSRSTPWRASPRTRRRTLLWPNSLRA
jgi:hypothetical protein